MKDRCPGCSRDVEESAEVCPYCGFEFAKPPERRRPPPEPSDCEHEDAGREAAPLPVDEWVVPKPKRWKVVLFGAAGILILVCAYYAPHVFRPDPIKKVKKRQDIFDVMARDRRERRSGMLAQGAAGPRLTSAEKAAAAASAERKRWRRGAGRGRILDGSDAGAKSVTGSWRITGTVFELKSLRPVNRASLIFRDAATGRRYRVRTDRKGRYRAHMPVNRAGFFLEVRHPRYRTLFMEDWVPSVRTFDRAKRDSLAYDLADQSREPDLIAAVADQALKKDYAVARAPR